MKEQNDASQLNPKATQKPHKNRRSIAHLTAPQDVDYQKEKRQRIYHSPEFDRNEGEGHSQKS